MVIGSYHDKGRTMRSRTHSAPSTSGWMWTQLSTAIPKFEPPQTKTVSGSVYGAMVTHMSATEESEGEWGMVAIGGGGGRVAW